MALSHISGYKKTGICNTVFVAGRYFVLLLLINTPVWCAAQVVSDYYVSNAGNDSLPGTSIAFPKKTIVAIAPALQQTAYAKGIVKLGLKAGDLFDEGLVTSYPIQVNSYSAGTAGNALVVLNGTKTFETGWVKAPGANFAYNQSIPYDGFVGYGIGAIGNYSFISVFEIDKELEKTAPFTARRLLNFMPGMTEVENNPGSFYTPVGNDNPMPVYIHTSDGNSPNDNTKYRYEVTVRDYGINSTFQPNNRFENLWVRGFGGGIGMLPGGDNSYYNKIVFGPGAGIHHVVVRGGTINHSLFLPGARNTNSFALTFYDNAGLGRHCTIKNSIFLDIPLPLYMHTSGGTNYGAVEMDSVVGFADSVLRGPFMYTANNDSVLIKNSYTDGYLSGYNYGNAKYAVISNSIFNNVQYGIAYNSSYNAINAIISNVFIKTKGADFVSGVITQNNTTLSLHNTVIHVTNSDNSPGNALKGAFIYGAGDANNPIIATGNIFICDIGANKYVLGSNTNTNNGIATSKDIWDNNVYILLKGDNIQWSVTNSATNGGSNVIKSFEDWKKQSGQDQHSLFFDLRNDPRGLRAIFEDPANGNYDLANTMEGRQVAALKAGMTDPISCFLKRPTYEEAADMIRNDKAFSVHICRNPCSQNSIKVNATFSLDSINSRQVKLKWNISEQNNIGEYVVQRATGNLNFKIIKSIPVTPDSLYTLVDNVQPGIDYTYRLMVIAKTGNKCYSDNKTIKFSGNKPFIIYPNPSDGKISISMNGYIGPVSFTVTNAMGQIVLVKQGASLYSAIALDLSNQPPGMYWIKVTTAKGFSVQNIIVQ